MQEKIIDLINCSVLSALWEEIFLDILHLKERIQLSLLKTDITDTFRIIFKLVLETMLGLDVTPI